MAYDCIGGEVAVNSSRETESELGAVVAETGKVTPSGVCV